MVVRGTGSVHARPTRNAAIHAGGTPGGTRPVPAPTGGIYGNAAIYGVRARIDSRRTPPSPSPPGKAAIRAPATQITCPQRTHRMRTYRVTN